VHRIGVDTIAVERMAQAVRRSGPRFLAKSFTPAELEYCAGRAEKLAGRWAAKEALIKCFDQSGICFPRRRIEVLPSSSGAPVVRLLGDAKGAVAAVSITHDSGLAVATAVLEMPSSLTGNPPVPIDVALPARPRDGHKGTFGTVVVLAGSLGLTGAAYLSATAAARSGAGMVRLLVAETIYPVLAVKCTEVMATPLDEVARGAVGHSSQGAVTRYMETAAAALVGPGLGRDSSTWRLVAELASHVQKPMVLDADALNALAQHPRTLQRLAGSRVLTPHPGEMARLTRRSIEEVQADRAETARRFSEKWKAVVVLKGARTVVAAPDGRVSVDPHEVPALGSGGTGDVLGGIIAGLLAQGSDPFCAAVTGVYVHAECGRRISELQGESGLLASDLLPQVPVVMQALREAGF
jgi:hydroxyethylthiazole kinase-like uncharacterized protein yjeF